MVQYLQMLKDIALPGTMTLPMQSNQIIREAMPPGEKIQTNTQSIFIIQDSMEVYTIHIGEVEFTPLIPIGDLHILVPDFMAQDIGALGV